MTRFRSIRIPIIVEHALKIPMRRLYEDNRVESSESLFAGAVSYSIEKTYSLELAIFLYLSN